ncbi:MAG TPA: hypothetical protein VFA59_06985 [Vicinamibacterales bacterium]|nr:hypothetical protein [Vicinamibacterales bacterium]
MTLFPNGGFFDGAGQGSATAHFNPNALPPQATGQVFSQNLVIDLIATPPGAPGFTTVTTVATCGVTLYGAVQ